MARKPEQAKLYYKEAIESGAPLNTIHDVIDDLKRLLIIIPLHPIPVQVLIFHENILESHAKQRLHRFCLF